MEEQKLLYWQVAIIASEHEQRGKVACCVTTSHRRVTYSVWVSHFVDYKFMNRVTLFRIHIHCQEFLDRIANIIWRINPNSNPSLTIGTIMMNHPLWLLWLLWFRIQYEEWLKKIITKNQWKSRYDICSIWNYACWFLGCYHQSWLVWVRSFHLWRRSFLQQMRKWLYPH